MQGQHHLPGPPKQHRIRLPVPKGLAVSRRRGAFGDQSAVRDEGGRTAPLAPPSAALPLRPWQIAPPGVVLVPGGLGVDEPVDTLVGDHRPPGRFGQWPAICSGDHPQLRRSRTQARSASSRSRRAPDQRRALACLCAYTGRYPPVRDPLCFNSRATVDGARSRAAAICRTAAPSARRRAISHRSSIESCRYPMATP